MGYVEDMRALVGHRLLLLAGANVIITDDKQRILLQLRRDGGWGLPGGLLEPGESLEQTAIREVKEETNLDVHGLTLLGTFSGADYTFTLENKDRINVITSLYEVTSWSGSMRNDPAEGLALTFFAASEIPAETKDEYRIYIDHYLSHRAGKQ